MGWDYSTGGGGQKRAVQVVYRLKNAKGSATRQVEGNWGNGG